MTWYPEADLDHDDTTKGTSLVRVSQSSTAGRSIDKLVEHSMIDGDRDGAAAGDVVDTWMELNWIVNVHGWHSLVFPRRYAVVTREAM